MLCCVKITLFYSSYALVLHLNQRALYILSEFFHVIYFELHPFKKHIDIRSLKQKYYKCCFMQVTSEPLELEESYISLLKVQMCDNNSFGTSYVFCLIFYKLSWCLDVIERKYAGRGMNSQLYLLLTFSCLNFARRNQNLRTFRKQRWKNRFWLTIL